MSTIVGRAEIRVPRATSVRTAPAVPRTGAPAVGTATVVRAIVPTGSAVPRGRPTAMVPVPPVPQAGCAVHRHLASAASRTPLAVAEVTTIAVKGAVTTAIVAPARSVR